MERLKGLLLHIGVMYVSLRRYWTGITHLWILPGMSGTCRLYCILR